MPAMEIVHEKIERYLSALHPVEDTVLREMEALGHARRFPIVGPIVGRILCQYASLLRAETIFEMGSGFGYSTYWFALALPASGQIYHTDTNPEHSRQAREFFRRGGLPAKVHFLTGDALELIDETRGEFDVIFIDIEKENYPEAYEKAKKRLRWGGLLIADNALWGGQVLAKRGDAATEGIKRFNERLAADSDFLTIILPVRDGLSVSLKLATLSER